jgi:hypothetical protein
MTGLVPVIHAGVQSNRASARDVRGWRLLARTLRGRRGGTAWMTGTSPVMTAVVV